MTIACRVGYNCVAFGVTALEYKLRIWGSGDAKGGGIAKSFDERSSLAVGEVLGGMADEVVG